MNTSKGTAKKRGAKCSQNAESCKIAPDIPFYLNGSLSKKKMTAIEAHLLNCSICQEDLQVWTGIMAAGAPKAVQGERLR